MKTRIVKFSIQMTVLCLIGASLASCSSLKADQVTVKNLTNSPEVRAAILKAPGVVDNKDGTITIPLDYVYEMDCNQQDGLSLGSIPIIEKDQPEIELDWNKINFVHTDLSTFLKDALFKNDRYDFFLTDTEIAKFCPNGRSAASSITTSSGKSIYYDNK